MRQICGMPMLDLSSPRRQTIAAGLFLVFAWALFVARWWMGDAVVPWDSKNHFFAMLRFLAASFHAGEIPLWNPFHFGGHPSIADPQALLFTPTLAWLALVTPQPSLKLFDLVVFGHLLAGGLAAMLLARRWGFHAVAAAFVGPVFMLGGSAAGRLQHTGMIVSYALFPMAWLLLEIMVSRRSFAAAAGFGLVAALMALGRDQVAFLFCLVLIARALTLLWGSQRRVAFIMARLPLLVLAGLVGVLVLSVPALLTLQFLADSNRPEIGLGTALKGSLAPANIATMLMPDVFGSLTSMYTYWGPGPATLGPGDWTDPSVNYLFFGTLPFVLILALGVVSGRLLDREIRFVAVTGLIALIYALGRHTPLFQALFEFIPGVSLYRRPADATFILNAMTAFATGYIVDRLIRGDMARLGEARVALVASALLGLGAIGIWYAVAGGRLPDAVKPAILGVFMGAAALGLITLVLRQGAQARIALVGVGLALTAGELAWRNGASMVNAEPRARYAVLEAPAPDERAVIDAVTHALRNLTRDGRRPRVEIVGLPGPWMNAAMAHGIEDTVSYNPLRLDAYQRAIGPGENAGDINLRRFPRTFRGYHSMMARLLGIEIVVFDRPISRLPAHVPPFEATPLLEGPKVWVYLLPPATPRVVMATHMRVVDSDAMIEAHSIPNFDSSRVALVDAATPLQATYPEEAARGEASIVRYGANRVEVSASSATGGVLVLHDLSYPGWVAEIDGRRVPLLKANLLFRGVEVPAGTHRVVFRFEPLSLEALAEAVTNVLGGG